MKTKRKNKPGAGRPPIHGEPTRSRTIQIPLTVDESLIAEAKWRDVSVSVVAVERLKRGEPK